MERKVIPLGQVPNTDFFWEKFQYTFSLMSNGKKVTAPATDYLLVLYPSYRNARRKVVANLDMGQLVALRASIDAIVAAEAEGGHE